MKRALVVSTLLILSGCVSKSDFEAKQHELDVCDRDKVAAQKSASDCESRLDTESKRWTGIETQLSTTLPQTLKSFEDERAKIIELVPQQVRNEVGKRLDRYFVQVTKQMQKMEGKVDVLKDQLDSSRAQLGELTTATRQVDTKVEATHKAVIEEQTRTGEQNRKVSDIVTFISEFDRDKVSCEKCKERIKLKGEGRERLLAFHSELIQRLQTLQPGGGKE